jgi:hypothetical protein
VLQGVVLVAARLCNDYQCTFFCPCIVKEEHSFISSSHIPKRNANLLRRFQFPTTPTFALSVIHHFTFCELFAGAECHTILSNKTLEDRLEHIPVQHPIRCTFLNGRDVYPKSLCCDSAQFELHGSITLQLPSYRHSTARSKQFHLLNYSTQTSTHHDILGVADNRPVPPAEESELTDGQMHG